MLGVYHKIQEICSKMGTKIFKIDGEMPKIIEHKVGNPQISISRKWANLSQPWNLTFFEDEVFRLFFSIICPRSTRMKNRPYWMVKQAQNIRKTPKYKGFRGVLDWSTLLRTPCMLRLPQFFYFYEEVGGYHRYPRATHISHFPLVPCTKGKLI